MIDKAPHALGRVIQEVAQESAQNPSAASAAVVASVAKRERKFRDHNLRGAEAAAKARAKRENKAVGASQPPKGSDLEPARKCMERQRERIEAAQKSTPGIETNSKTLVGSSMQSGTQVPSPEQ